MLAKISFQNFGRRLASAQAVNCKILPMFDDGSENWGGGDWPDLNQCAREPLKQLGPLQNFGALLAMGPDQTIAHAAGHADLTADLRAAQVALQELRIAEKQQEVLIAELNHRVRNILGLVCSLVGQSRSGATSVDDFAEAIGQRVHALARAHDLITTGNWSPSSGHALILTEAQAYLGNNAARVRLRGPDPQLTPAAISTMALVIHELMTNSVKYGAMSTATGELLISFAQGCGGALELSWEERGGPAITVPPVRRGFGSTLVERSIPHDLGGTTEIDFARGGLRVNLSIPALHVIQFLDTADGAGLEPTAALAAPLTGPVLLVEDNMLIALNVEEILRNLGANEVRPAGSVIEAQGMFAAGGIEFAVLDLNLGGETTEQLGRTLLARGIPFVFATGYGDTSALAADFPGVEIVLKPYETSALQAAISRALARAAT